MSQLSILQYFNRDLECKYSERERMMGGSTRVKGTMWSPGGRWGPWWTPTLCSTYSLELVKWSVRVWLLTVLVSVQSTSLFPTSSMSTHGEECPKALKKRPAFPLYSTSSSFSSQNKRGKSYKKDRTTLPWEMFSSLALYTMLASRVKSNILVINVTIKLLHREIWRFIFSLYMKKSNILAINVIIKLPQMGIWRLIFSQYMKKSNILAINVIIKLQETNIAMRERGRDRTGLFLFYYYTLLLIQFNVPSVLVFVNLQHYLKDSLPIIRYPCSSCEYKSRNKGKFNSHIQVKHNGGSQKFPCSQCEYKASII